MKSTWYFQGKIVDSILQFRNIQEWKDFCHLQEGKNIELFANPILRKRTNQQNKLLWAALMQTIAIHTGHEKSEIHQFFEQEFAERKPITLGKKTHFSLKTCSELSTPEFSEWIERVKQFARENLDMIFE